MSKRIIVTGGSGKAGRYVILYLLSQGHQVLNLDLTPLASDLADRVHTLKVDLTDAGQVYSALLSHFRLTEPFREPLNTPPDAVVHLGGIARNMLVPDVETFRVNTLGTYNITEAACRLGVKKIILASTVCVYGVTFAEGDVSFASFPVDESLDVNPMDIYALSKVCAEKVARSFAARFGIDIYALRIGAVITPEEREKMFEGYINEPAKWKVHGWSYIDAQDLGKMCHLAVNKKRSRFPDFQRDQQRNHQHEGYRRVFEGSLSGDTVHTGNGNPRGAHEQSENPRPTGLRGGTQLEEVVCRKRLR